MADQAGKAINTAIEHLSPVLHPSLLVDSVKPMVDLALAHPLKDTSVGFKDALPELVVVVCNVITVVGEVAGHPCS